MMILQGWYSSLAFISLTHAAVLVEDPSDKISSADWAADNLVVADYTVTAGFDSLLTALAATVHIDDTDEALTHTLFSATANDTSVISIANGANVNVSHVTAVKSGYSTNLNQASFFGVNAAVNVANHSTAQIAYSNITTHNGAAMIYSYGTNTSVSVSNSWLYSSGPVAHGLYAAGNGSIYGSNLEIFTGGIRSSAISGDMPGGYINVRDASVHTAGRGSAVGYAVGELNLTNVVGVAENAPAMFMDGDQYASFTNCQLSAGLLSGTVQFSSNVIQEGSTTVFVNSKLNATGNGMPALWFGNINAKSYIINTQLITKSGILAIANYSQVTQEFNYFAGYEVNSDLSPAVAELLVTESNLSGDLVAYNGSTISINLASYSSWKGSGKSGYGKATFGVTLDKTSNWTLTANTNLLNFTNADTTLSNVLSSGYNVTYNASNNAWLNHKTVTLNGGGYAVPA